MSIRFLLCYAFPWALIILARWAPRFLFLFHVSFCYPGSWTSFFRFPLLYPPHNVRTAFFNVVFPYLNAPFFIYVYAAIFRFFLPALGSLFACNESAYFSCGSFLLYTPWAGILRKVPLPPSLAISISFVLFFLPSSSQIELCSLRLLLRFAVPFLVFLSLLDWWRLVQHALLRASPRLSNFVL